MRMDSEPPAVMVPHVLASPWNRPVECDDVSRNGTRNVSINRLPNLERTRWRGAASLPVGGDAGHHHLGILSISSTTLKK